MITWEQILQGIAISEGIMLFAAFVWTIVLLTYHIIRKHEEKK